MKTIIDLCSSSLCLFVCSVLLHLGLKPRSSLATAHGALSLMRPPGPFQLCPPRYTVTFPTDETLNGTTDTVNDLAAEISAHLSKLVIERKCPSPTPITYNTPSVKAVSGGSVGKDGSDRSGAVTPESSIRGGTPLSIGNIIRCLRNITDIYPNNCPNIFPNTYLSPRMLPHFPLLSKLHLYVCTSS